MKRKAYRENTKHVKIDCFLYDIYIVLSTDVIVARSKRDNILGICDYDNASGIHSANDCGRSYVFLPFDFGPDLVAHESYHAADAVRRFMAASYDKELMAYLVGYITKTIVEFREKVAKNLHRRGVN